MPDKTFRAACAHDHDILRASVRRVFDRELTRAGLRRRHTVLVSESGASAG